MAVDESLRNRAIYMLEKEQKQLDGAFDKQAEYGAPFSASPHLPNLLPVDEYLSHPPPPAPPPTPFPNHLRKSSSTMLPQLTQVVV